MANPRYSQNISNLKQPATGKGVKPLPRGKSTSSYTLNETTASWPGLPGKTQSRDRSLGFPEEKIYVRAAGLRGGAENDYEDGSRPMRKGPAPIVGGKTGR
jgi:hypothetical protein